MLSLALVTVTCLTCQAHASYIPVYSPQDIAIGEDGNVYAIMGTGSALDRGLYVFAPDGRLIKSFPRHGNDSYADIAIDGAGNVYLYDSANRRVVKPEANGSFSTFWREDLADHSISDVEAGLDGYVYCADFNFSGGTMNDRTNGRIIKLSPNGTILDLITGSPSMPLVDLIHISVSANGTIYLATGTRSLRVFYPDGGNDTIYHTSPDNGTFFRAMSAVAAEDGYLYVNDVYTGVKKIDPNGTLVAEWVGCGPEGFAGVYRIAVDDSGRVYACDPLNQRLFWFDSNNYRYVIGGSNNTDGKGILWGDIISGDNYSTARRIMELENGDQQETPGFSVTVACLGFGFVGIILCLNRFRRY